MLDRKPKRAQYADLEIPKTMFGERDYGMRPVKSIRTYIQAGSAFETEEDGIHLQQEVKQESIKE